MSLHCCSGGGVESTALSERVSAAAVEADAVVEAADVVVHGYQMAIAKFVDCKRLAVWA